MNAKTKSENDFDVIETKVETQEDRRISLSQRLKQCAKLVGSGDLLAQETAIPRRTLETYLSGGAEPKAYRLSQIAESAMVSLDWLASGKGRIIRYGLTPELAKDDLQRFYQLPERIQKHARARLEISEATLYIAVDLSLTIHEAIREFSTTYNSGKVSQGSWVRKCIQTVSEDDIRSWLRDYRTRGLSGLASDINDGCLNEEPNIIDNFNFIPLYDVKASAGPGAAIDQENKVSELAFRKDWLSQEGLNSSHLSAITADGDSMEPTILDGSVLLIDTSQRTLTGEQVYVLRLRDHLYAKRLQRLLDGAIRVSSDNRAYADELVPADELESLDIIGRVVWIGRRV